MAWSDPAERLAAIQGKAERAEARAEEYRARAASLEARGKHDKAAEAAVTADRQERIARTHRQEVERLEIRARQAAGQAVAAEARKASMQKAQQRAEQMRAGEPEIDPLQAFMQALQCAAELDAEAAHHEKRAKAYRRAGDAQKAEIASGGAQRARQDADRWRTEIEKIQGSTSRDLAREMKLALRGQQRAAGKAKTEAERLDRLGVVSDLRTAAGQRAIASGGRGRGKAVASLHDYASLIRKPQERTRARLEAMEAFDGLCATADAGLYPEPKFEREGTGYGPGADVASARIAGLQKMDDLRDAIGGRNVDMLRAWIHERQTLTALVRAGFGTEKTAGALCIAAVDSVAVFFKTRDALQARLAAAGRPQPTQSAGEAAAG